MEFTRTTEFWSDSLGLATQREDDNDGNVLMLQDLKKATPGWEVEILTSVLGQRAIG